MTGFLARGVFSVAMLCAALPLCAQSDFANTDAHRPLRVRDALVTERQAREWHVASAWERDLGSRTGALFDVGLTHGWWRGGQLELSAPIDARGGRALRGAQVDLQQQLNRETLSWPALAVGVTLSAHDGKGAGAVFAAATRSTRAGRLHANASLAPRPPRALAEEAPRWMAGLAVDRVFPLAFVLVGTEVVAERHYTDAETTWSWGGGARMQVTPALSLEGGVHRSLSTDGTWRIHLGLGMVSAATRLGIGR